AIKTQYHAHLEWVKEMQEMGFSYCGEDLGVFGIHRHGPDMDMMLDTLPIWGECIINFDEKIAIRSGFDPLRLFFKGLAYRIMWNVQWRFKSQKADAGISDPKAYVFLNIFNAVNELMHTREILRSEEAITYLSKDGKTKVWWVLKDHIVKLEGKSVINNISENRKSIAGSLDAKALSVYTTSLQA
nr:hypothetical protein [Chitinophagaceae bacterium]